MKELQLVDRAEQFKNVYSRSIAEAVRQNSFDEKTLSIKNVVATELPAIVFDWYRWEPIREILIMKGAIVPASRQVVMLDNHSRFTVYNVVGSTRDLTLTKNFENLGDVYLGDSIFHSKEEHIISLVREGHLTDTSVGYRTFDDKSVVLKKGEKTSYNGITYENKFEDGLLFVIRGEWEIKENSITPIGADIAAKFRSEFTNYKPQTKTVRQIFINPGIDLKEQLEAVNNELKEKSDIEIQLINSKQNQRSNTMPEPIVIDLNAPEVRTQIDAKIKEERDADAVRAKGIRQMAIDQQKNVPHIKLIEKGEEYIATGKSEKEFYQFLSTEMKNPEAVRTPDTYVDFEKKELESYSFAKVLDAVGKKDFSKLGIELKASQEIAKRLSKDSEPGHLFIPLNAFGRNLGGLQKRVQVVGTPSLGGATVPEENVGPTFIEYLHNTSAFIGAGVTVLDGLSSDVPFYRETSEHSFTWNTETTGPDASDVTFTSETYGPKHGGVRTKISRQMLLQSPYVGEAYARRKIVGAAQRGIDRGFAYGTGLGNEPTGFMNISGTNQPVLGASFDRAKAIDVITSIRADNAELGSFNFITNPITKGNLQKVPVSGAFPMGFLCDDNGKMVSKMVNESNQIDLGDLFYSAWSLSYLLMWGYMDVSANPFGDMWPSGGLDIRALLAVNYFFEYPQSIAIVEGVNPAI